MIVYRIFVWPNCSKYKTATTKKRKPLTSSFRFSQRPHGLSSKISLSSSESSPLSLGDLCSDSLLLDRLPGMAECGYLKPLCFVLTFFSLLLLRFISFLPLIQSVNADQSAHFIWSYYSHYSLCATFSCWFVNTIFGFI